MKILPLIYRRRTSVVDKKAATFGVITLITYLIPENAEIELSVSARDFMIDWGDGVCDKNMIHTYTKEGEYVIRICGECINELRVPKCYLENIDVSFCKWLEHLDCSFNWIEELDVSGLSYLVSLDCSHNALNNLKIGEQELLLYLDCSDNMLPFLDVSTCPSLTYLYTQHNGLRSFKVSSALSVLDIGDNQLSSEDVADLKKHSGIRYILADGELPY